MANRKISDLTALTAPVTGDLLPIVDISEAAAADKNKKITYGTFLSSVPLGTAAAPSIAFTGDTNTGIYSPGADQLAIATGGTGRVFVDATGKVGIGTTSPLTKLEVRSGVITAGSIDAPNGSEILRGYYGSNGALVVIGSEYSSGGTVIGYAVKPSTSASDAFFSSASGAFTRGAYTIAGNVHKWYIGGSQTVAENSSVTMSEAMRIDASGRLLVSTSSNSGGALLQVNGDRIRVGTAKTPATSGATGTTGEIAWDANYIYVCTATNTWKRSAIATW